VNGYRPEKTDGIPVAHLGRHAKTVGVNLHDWIDELCDVLDIEVEVDEALILDLARDAAHQVERPAAPISTFLLGYAAAQFDGKPAQVERLAAQALALAARWDKSPEELEHELDDEEVEAVLEVEV
jgi:hypothetical protein